MSTLVAWLQDPKNKWIEPRDLHAYLDGHPEAVQTVNTPDASGTTPLAFVAGQGQGDMAQKLIARGATPTAKALQAYNRFVKENPDENDVETQTWMRAVLKPVTTAGRRRRTMKKKGRRVATSRRHRRAFQS